MLNRRKFTSTCLAISSSVFSPAILRAQSPNSNLAQTMLVGFRGTNASDGQVELIRKNLEQNRVAGVLLLERNIKSPEQLEKLITALNESSTEHPPIIAIDQEGGKVSRLGKKNGFLDWNSASKLSKQEYSVDEITAYYQSRALEMSEVGINLNFAPVVDLNSNPFNPIIGKLGRSFGSDVESVVKFAEIVISTHRNNNIKTCLKHFPGHGSSTTDSHTEITNITDSWSDIELEPYRKLIDKGLADSIMNSHLIHPNFSDDVNIPASLSMTSVNFIRNDLNFDGLIVSDDMQMKSISEEFETVDAAVKCISAGNSLLIYSNYQDEYNVETSTEIGEALRSQVSKGNLSKNLAQSAIDAVLAFRSSL